MAKMPTTLESRIIKRQYPNYGLLPQPQQQQILREVRQGVRQQEAQRAAKRAEALEKARTAERAERAMFKAFLDELRALAEQQNLRPQGLESADGVVIQTIDHSDHGLPKAKCKSAPPKRAKSPKPKKQGRMPKSRRTKGVRKSSHWRH